MRLRPNSAFFLVSGDRRSGYTLVEMLVAITLTMILMTAVVTVFGGVGDGIAKSRRSMEQFDRLRTAAQQLRLDLQGVTVTLDGRPARPEENRGYFEYIEGGFLSVPQQFSVSSGTLQGTVNISSGTPQAINDVTGATDSTVGERGDILMFTTRNATRPFLGRYALSADSTNPTLQSDVAEVAWFLRGTTLHRRFLLVAPGVAQNANFANLSPSTFFQYNDISVRLVNGQLVPNSLGDLTKRENRFAHPASTFPFDARAWGILGLPTLAECSSQAWMAKWVNGTTPPVPSPLPNPTSIDYWDNSTGTASIAMGFFGNNSGTASPDQYLVPSSGTCTRLADDVVLTNVIGFDVKVWEPAANNGAGGYMDLGYYGYPPVQGSATTPGISPIQLKNYLFPQGPANPRFQHPGIYAFSQPYSLVADGSTPYRFARVYDSGCFSYENEGIYNFNNAGTPVPIPSSSYPTGLGPGASTNGLDDDGDGIVDDISECINSAPYPVPLRGIQITIRCFEPNSRQVRQITIEHDFLPK